MNQLKWCTGLALIFVFGLVAADALECLKCDTQDANCPGATNIGTEVCEGKCFTKLDNGILTRGCIVDASGCTGDTCLTCDSAKCNTNLICKKCSSTEECNQVDIANAALNSICPVGQTKCISRVLDNRTVERRCATGDDTKNCPSGTCTICDGANCNSGIFPSGRLQCYKCSNENCGTVVASQTKICQYYDANDKCYTIGKSATEMSRGCKSDDNAPCSDEKTAGCLVCNNKNNCNNREYLYDQEQRCVKCADATNCPWGQDASNAEKCANKIQYNQEGGCFYASYENKTVERGCIFDRSDSQCNAPNCITCTNGNGCNNKDVGAFTCIRCRDSSDRQCRYAADANKIGGAECRNTVTKDTAECYAGVWNGVIIRGCLVDADERQKLECRKANSNCQTCKDTPNCNKDLKVAGAATLKISISLFLGILIIFWRLH